MKIKFCGAARTVTGSMHYIDTGEKTFLLDCGLYQGKREKAYDINKNFPFEPAKIDAVILSHAHIDHIGNIPTLVKKGFNGDIYCTPATRDLASVMLTDSAHIQARDIEYVNKKRISKDLTSYKALYSFEDVKKSLSLFKAIPYRRKFTPYGFNNITAEFLDAGHILGSASVRLVIENKNYTIGFTGDLGRPGLPILRDPEFIGKCEVLISESTYGGRYHDKIEDMDEQFALVLKESLNRGGKIIVPAFSLGRTQEVVYSLSRLFSDNIIPSFPIYIDSPLSANISEIFKIHTECYDSAAARLISQGTDIFGFSNLTYVSDVKDSKRLNTMERPCMVISASGMCESGRILHHLKHSISSSDNTILIVGYQAEHTLGRRLVEAKDEPGRIVKIFGEEYPVNARVYVLNSFSAHADRGELLNYFRNFGSDRPDRIFLVHGDYDQQKAFKDALCQENFLNIEIPERLSEYEL